MKSNYTWTKSSHSPQLLDTSTVIKITWSNSVLITELIESFVETKRSSQTRRAYQRDVSDFCVYVWLMTVDDLQSYPIAQLSHQILARVKTHYKTDLHHPDKILNASTVNRKAYAVSSWFEYLMAVYQYPKNPAKIFTPLKTSKQSSTESLTKLEYVKLLHYQKDIYTTTLSDQSLNTIKQLRDYLMLSMMCMSLRRNEVAKLTRESLNHTTPHISVYQKWGSTKLIPLPSPLFGLLKDLQNLKMAHGLTWSYIFSPIKNNSTWELDKPISGDYIFQLIVKLSKLCGIDKNITPHSLRKTFIELALDAKEDYINIANATGHSTLEMIKYYDTRSKLEKNAINTMWDVFD